MSEQQFWESNPRIIKVWEKMYKEEAEHKNAMIHTFVGTYGISALLVAIDSCLNGKKAKAKYIDKPIELFKSDKLDDEQSAEIALNKFKNWANAMMGSYTK